MKKILFSLVTALFLTLGSTTAFADGPSPTMPSDRCSSSDMSSSTSSSSSSSGYGSSSYTTNVNVNVSSQQSCVYVTIRDNGYVPSAISVGQGTAVIWTNAGTTDHTVSSDISSGPNSATLSPGDSYTYTFNHTGVFGYHCKLHSDMVGTVRVTASSTSPSPQPQPQPQPQPTQQPHCGWCSPSYVKPTTIYVMPRPNLGYGTGNINVSNVNNVGTAGYQTPATTTTTAPTYKEPTYVISPTSITKEQPTALPDTGPAETIALFIAATFAGSGAYYVYLLRKAKAY